MNKQEVYDRVLIHLRTQRVKSIDPEIPGTGCAYRGIEGRACAIGCLIPDALYNEGLEGRSAGDLPYELYEAIGLDRGEHASFLTGLQKLHDEYMPREIGEPMLLWELRMLATAAYYGLTYIPNLGTHP
jgi:hypothetical protein